MKKGEIATGYVEDVEFPNKGIVLLEEENGPDNGKTTRFTVKNVIPGQKISFRIKKVRKGKGEGNLLEVLEKADNEIESSCPHFGICGGCTYLNLSYENQAKLKEKQVKKLLDSVLSKQERPYEYLDIRKSPAVLGYRNKMEFSFGDEYKEGPLALGMHKRGSFYDIVTVNRCQICDEDYRKILTATLEFFGDKQLSHYHRLHHTGYLRHLLVRKAANTGEILIALITTTQESMDLEPYREKLLSLSLSGKIVSILHTLNDSVADVVKSDKTIVFYGREYIKEEILGLQFNISQFSFFQTNTLGAEVLYSTVRELIGSLGSGEKTVYDLYSGTGTIAQLMAPVAQKVIGVEIVEEAVEAARENAKLNQLDNCEFIAGDVLKVLDTIEEKPDFIILDPPRDGIHPKALRKIIDYGVDRLVYISCKPTSLVRDLEVFLQAGYFVETAVAVDQFPWTANVETVVLLSHKKPDSHINVKVEFGEGEGKIPIDGIAERAEVYKPKEKVTYKMIKEYIEAKYGFKVHTAYIAEVKRDLGLPMYDAPNAVEELKRPRNHPIPEKVDAIKDALKHFEII